MLEQKRGEMRLIQDDLNQKRLKYEEHEEVWKKREELLQKKKKEFYEKIQDMKSFTKQTASKIEKYTEKAREERGQNEVKDKQITTLQTQLAACTKRKNKLEKELENVMECQKYLESVLKIESSFDEIDKIIKRYDTLSAANKELQIEIEDFKNESKETNHLFKTASKEGQNTILELTSTLGQTRNKLEKFRSLNNKEENNLRTLEEVSMKTVSRIYTCLTLCIVSATGSGNHECKQPLLKMSGFKTRSSFPSRR
jgi:chromosome segregation ATPase